MKDSINSMQLAPHHAEQMAAQLHHLKTIQQGLLVGWGSLLTFVIMAFSMADPYMFGMAGPYDFGRGGIRLWLFLLFVPGTVALFVWQWPSWQEIPMQFRRNVIFSGLALSWATYLSFVSFHIAWNSDDIIFISIIGVIGLGLGLLLFGAAWRLQKQIAQEGELFP